MNPSGRRVVGVHAVAALLEADTEVRRIRVAADRRRSAALRRLLEAAERRGVPVEWCDRRTLDQLAPGLVHQGVVADAPPFPYLGLDALVARLRGPEPALVVALDGVTDPHNLGAIARTAEAVGAHGLLLPTRRAAPVTATAEKAAAGALAFLPVVRAASLPAALRRLGEVGLWRVGLDADGPTTIYDCPLWTEPVVLTVGSEGRGLRRTTRLDLDAIVRLPTVGRTRTLNASVAAAVALYEVLRRRGA